MSKTETIQRIPLSKIVESKLNPRTILDDQEKALIADLASSIKEKGMLNAILLRQVGSKYEIIAGHRRYAAQKLNKATEVEAIVKKVNDTEALELATIENLQRRDVHPMDEAEAFAKLLKTKKTIQAVAAAVGKQEGYVAKWLQVTKLIDKAKKYFRTGVLPATHALIIARLSETDQKEALSFCVSTWGDDKCIKSAKELQVMIKEKIVLELKDAPFDTKDATLYTKAGACASCPKNTKSNALLFDDIAADARCTDSWCYDIKADNHLRRRIKAMKDAGKKFFLAYDGYHTDREKFDGMPIMKLGTDYKKANSKNPEKNAITVLIIGGDRKFNADPGTELLIVKSIENTRSYDGRPAIPVDETPAQAEARKQKARHKKYDDQAIFRTREKVMDLIMDKTCDLSPTELRIAAERVLRDISLAQLAVMRKRGYKDEDEDLKAGNYGEYAKYLDLKKDGDTPEMLFLLPKSGAELLQLIRQLIAGNALEHYRRSNLELDEKNEDDELLAIAKDHGIDWKTIYKKEAEEFELNKKEEREKLAKLKEK